MEKIVLVTGDRHNPAAHHIKLAGTARVGRSFDCDVILSDNHIEPEQMVFHLAGDTRQVEVLPGTNPVRLNGKIVEPGMYPFASGDEWTFGKTTLTAFSEQHAVEPAQKILLQELSGGKWTQISLSLFGTLVLAGWIGLQGWLAHYQPLEGSKDVAALLSSSGYVWFVLFWSVIIGAVGRFTSGRGQFNLHLMMAVSFVIASSCFETLANYLSYALNPHPAWAIARYAGNTLILASFLLVSVTHLLNIRGMKYMVLGLSVAWSGLDYLGELAERNPLEPHYDASLKPPFAQLWEGDSVDNFLRQAPGLFAEARQHTE